MSEESREKMVCMWLTLVPLEDQELEEDHLSLGVEILSIKCLDLGKMECALGEQVEGNEK